MAWSDDWIGIPYEELGRGPNSYDCLGLVLAIYRSRFGVDLPDPECSLTEAVRKQTANSMRPLFQRTDDPKEGDLAIFHVRSQLLHVGFVLDRRDMIHTASDKAASLIECWNGTRYGGKLEGVYRYAV